jgi:pimeloyl-ACP methyl ester carboxylesterase
MYKKAAQAILICFIALFSSSNIYAISTFVKYPQNPLLTGDDPSVLYKDGMYKMWYVVNYGQGWRINYAYSQDGINNWIVPQQTVIPIGSPDGFEMDNANPNVIFNRDLNIYQMWYTSIGYNWSGGPDRFRLRYATSQDGTNWTKYNGYVLEGTTSAWDTGGPARGVSVLYANGSYKMWYAAADVGFGNWKIGYAASNDGVNWVKGNNGQPIIYPTTSWELNSTEYPNVIINNGTYEMFYGSSSGDNTTQLVYATSSDGLQWDKPADKNPLLTGTQGGHDGITMEGPSAILQDNGITMLWYGGNVQNIMLAYDEKPTPTPPETPAPTPEPTPTPPKKVVVVPGVAGSWNYDALYYCKLNGYSGNWTPWRIKTFNINEPLLNALTENGYIPVPFYYDWRKPVTDSAPLLASFIQNNVPVGETADLVGHSLGGLVSRAYLSQLQTNSRLEKLLTVGSPHQGSLLAYPAWSGGQVKGDITWRLAAAILKNRCQKYHNWTPRETIQRALVSVQNTLPTFDFLKDRLTGIMKPVSSMIAKNNWLPNSFNSPFFGVTVGTLSGTGHDTLSMFETNPPSRDDKRLGNWLDGKPTQRQYFDDGDGTVLTQSSQLAGADNRTVSSDHNGLVSQSPGINKIIDFLNGAPDAAPLAALKNASPVIAPTENTSALLIIVDGATATLTDKKGNKTSDSDGQITILDPGDDPYTLTVHPKKWSYKVIVAQLFDDGTDVWKEYTNRGIFPRRHILRFDRKHKRGDILDHQR